MPNREEPPFAKSLISLKLADDGHSWDAASELTGITYTSGTTTLGNLTYGYDLTGRINARGGSLFQSVLPAAVASATYDLANRLTARTAAGVTASPTFDANGNLTNDGVRTYVWDSRNRLTGITGVASFVYDALGRRQTATRNGTATSFLYDFGEVAQEQEGGSPSADLLLGLGIDERLSRSGSTFLTDALGSTTALASAGAVQTSYGYDPYGASQITGTASDNTFQFTGRENDGTDLLNYRNRYYNPTWGRFISEDPIGLGGGINMYRYADNNPVQGRDPSGNNTIALGAGIGTLIEPGFGTLIGAGLGALGTAGAICYFNSWCNPPGPAPSPSTQPTQPDPCLSGNVSCASNPGPKDAPRQTRPIDQWGIGTGDIHDIKSGLGAGPTDWIGITPGGDVITVGEDGEAVNAGHVDDYTNRPLPQFPRR